MFLCAWQIKSITTDFNDADAADFVRQPLLRDCLKYISAFRGLQKR